MYFQCTNYNWKLKKKIKLNLPAQLLKSQHKIDFQIKYYHKLSYNVDLQSLAQNCQYYKQYSQNILQAFVPLYDQTILSSASCLLLLWHPISTYNTSMISFKRFQCHLLGWLELFLLQLFDFLGKHCFCWNSRVNAICLRKYVSIKTSNKSIIQLPFDTHLKKATSIP